VNALWINPCFVSPFKDAGYDVVDYCAIAPRYGTNDSFKALLDAAHARDIRICLDLVAGHTSDQHPWFIASQQAQHGEFSDRYVWTHNPWVTRDEELTFISGNSERAGSYAVNFFAHQPALNYGFGTVTRGYQQRVDAPGPRATQDALKAIMKFWLDSVSTASASTWRRAWSNAIERHRDPAPVARIAAGSTPTIGSGC
jgi:maltose alpha-D-glucosyltransferase/alpha-amylase